jgi:hypothetical protein
VSRSGRDRDSKRDREGERGIVLTREDVNNDGEEGAQQKLPDGEAATS